MPPSPSSTLFPYTTLFRSCRVGIEIFKSSQDHAFWKRPDQPASQALEPLLRAAKGIRLLGIGVNHEVKLAEHVVDHRELIGDEEQHIRRAERIGLLATQCVRFNVAHRLVAELAHQAA